MVAFLERVAAAYRGAYGRQTALLLSDSPDAAKVRRWLERQPANHLDGYENVSLKRRFPGVIPTVLEARLLRLARSFENFTPPSAWARASARQRLAHSKRVAQLAEGLAAAMEEAPRPYYPSALALFDEDRAADIARAMEGATALLKGTRFADDGEPAYEVLDDKKLKPVWTSAAAQLAARFYYPEEQRVPSMLRNLAQRARCEAQDGRSAGRPNTGDVDARAFAAHVYDNLLLEYGTAPISVVAACVNLRSTVAHSDAAVRQWLRNSRGLGRERKRSR